MLGASGDSLNLSKTQPHFPKRYFEVSKRGWFLNQRAKKWFHEVVALEMSPEGWGDL